MQHKSNFSHLGSMLYLYRWECISFNMDKKHSIIIFVMDLDFL